MNPKLHAVFFHIEDFCDESQGLGFLSEKAMKLVHFDFNFIWKKHKMSLDLVQFAEWLQRAECEYNTLHVKSFFV